MITIYILHINRIVHLCHWQEIQEQIHYLIIFIDIEIAITVVNSFISNVDFLQIQETFIIDHCIILWHFDCMKIDLSSYSFPLTSIKTIFQRDCPFKNRESRKTISKNIILGLNIIEREIKFVHKYSPSQYLLYREGDKS